MSAPARRPSISSSSSADVRVDVRLDRDRATVSLDLSGDSLHRRAYRARGVAAPLKENLAAAVSAALWLANDRGSGWRLLDPMCGSGTLPIEAAMMALDVAPGLLRSYFGFIGWRGHDRALWARLIEEARERRARGLPLKQVTCVATIPIRSRFARRSKTSSARSCAASFISSGAIWSSLTSERGRPGWSSPIRRTANASAIKSG